MLVTFWRASAIIERTLASTAPRLKDLAELEIVPTDGLTYYKLKNYGIGQAKTDLSIMLDSDAAPQPGWLENLIKPFADPEMMAVGGFNGTDATPSLAHAAPRLHGPGLLKSRWTALPGDGAAE